MLRFVALAAAATACAAITSTAWAADVGTAPAYNWTGFYVGGTAGYGTGKSDYLHITTDWFDFAGGTYTNSVSGLLGGGFIGANAQAGNLVLGIEAAALASAVQGGKDYTQYSNSQQTTLNSLDLITGRLGFAANDWLFYGDGGFARGEVTAENLYYTAPTHAWSVTNSHNGWTVGLGIDKGVGAHVVVGVQYQYVKLNSVENNAPDSAGTPTDIANDLSLQTLVGRVALKF